MLPQLYLNFVSVGFWSSNSRSKDGADASTPQAVDARPIQQRSESMATTTVTVNVPEGVYAGDEFMLEFEGQQLSVTCPDGCQPGDAINLEIPAGDGGAPDGGAPQVVEITVPDGCFPGMEFTVDFNGQQFNIAVPDGVGPGEAIQVEVPHDDGAGAGGAPPAPPPPPGMPPPPPMPPPPMPPPPPISTRGSSVSSSATPPGMSLAEQLEAKAKHRANKGVRIDGKHQTAAGDATWNTNAGSLFEMNASEGSGRQAGDFHIGQLVQVWAWKGSSSRAAHAHSHALFTISRPAHTHCTLYALCTPRPLHATPSARRPAAEKACCRHALCR